jgi:hypothetical protein
MSVSFSKTNQHNIPEGSHLHTCCCENLKSHQHSRSFNFESPFMCVHRNIIFISFVLLLDLAVLLLVVVLLLCLTNYHFGTFWHCNDITWCIVVFCGLFEGGWWLKRRKSIPRRMLFKTYKCECFQGQRAWWISCLLKYYSFTSWMKIFFYNIRLMCKNYLIHFGR